MKKFILGFLSCFSVFLATSFIPQGEHQTETDLKGKIEISSNTIKISYDVDDDLIFIGKYSLREIKEWYYIHGQVDAISGNWVIEGIPETCGYQKNKEDVFDDPELQKIIEILEI